MFDDKLNWRLYLKKLKMECLSRMKIIKIFRNNTWGSETKCLIIIHKSLIRLIIDNGAIFYISAKNNILNTINPIHNQGIRLATGAFMTSEIDRIL